MYTDIYYREMYKHKHLDISIFLYFFSISLHLYLISWCGGSCLYSQLLGRLRQEDQEFKGSKGSGETLSQKNLKKGLRV
jgi:hypothetical protein